MFGFTPPRTASVLILLLTACVADPYGIPDPGPITQVEEPEDGRYSVTYRGAPGSTQEKTRELALLRAATITLQKGGDWFEVVTDYSRLQKEQTTRFERDPFGERASLDANCGVLGCPANGDAVLGQADIDPASITKTYPVQSFEIVIHSGERPRSRRDTYDAVELSTELRKRYSADHAD